MIIAQGQKGEKMRLIDADALIGYLHTQFFYESRDRSRVYKVIQEQPTIEPENEELDFVQPHKKLSVSLQPERKKGKWILTDFSDEDTYMCSVCQARIDPIDKFKSYFCYHCGADMGEGESNALD